MGWIDLSRWQDKMNRDADIELLTAAARSAGTIAMGYFGQDPDVWHKSGGSPVSEADMAVNAYLHQHLRAARPDHGWLSEESSESELQTDTDRLFIVDPIDGTRGFLAGDPRWAVSLAIVDTGRPASAVLYLPAAETMYWASAGAGAWRGETAIRTSDRDHLSGATLAGPTAWLKSTHMAKLDLIHHGYVPSLAYRIAMVADNLVDGAIARPGAHDWDLAAADLLVHEAGGRLTGLDGQALRYNEPALRHELLVAGSHHLHGPLIDIVQRVFDDKQAGQSQPTTMIRNR